MKIYCPNIKEGGIGGGWTFLRNFRKGMAEKVHFVNTWQECDIFFITGITLTDKNELFEAHKAGKKIVLRVDNVPRKSRNRRSSPHERLKEFANLADVVIYQSEWAKSYCYPLCGDGTVIYNGVDQEIFKPRPEIKNPNRYLFAYHGKNEQKGFWNAHFHFQMEFRKNPQAEFWFIYDFGREEPELHEADFDFWQGEHFTKLEKITDPLEMAGIMQQCSYFIYPAICDASPNVVLEAKACGLEVVCPASKELSGTQELIDLEDISLERMCDEYYGVFLLLEQNV
jgi:glycosyltransferase involved in cell wall biosynthesis